MRSFDEEAGTSPNPVEEASRKSSQEKIGRRALKIVGVVGVSALILTACVSGNESNQSTPTGTVETEESVAASEGLRDPEVLHRAEQIISTFENSTTEIQYDYVENLGDGRGITAGRAGFTSGTSDLLQVVETYVALGNENTPLAELLPALVAVDGTDSVEGLDDFESAWEEAIRDSDDLKHAQDMVYNKLYLDPALKWASQVGVHTALGQTIILDTIIQHGEGDDADGLPSIVQETIDKAGTVEGNEEEWLKVFLDIRAEHLKNAADPETREEWAESVDRVEALRSILESENISLDPPIHWEVYGDSFSIND